MRGSQRQTLVQYCPKGEPSPVNRRSFVALSLSAFPPVAGIAWAQRFGIERPLLGTPRRDEIVVIGGGLGGCAAACAAAQSGRRVVLAVEGDWLGGQLTAQAAPPDEHPWIETHGSTASYRALREAIRKHYRDQESLNGRARAMAELNPGNCWVSRLGVEPRIAASVLEQLLAPWVRHGTLRILRRVQLIGVDTDHDRIWAVVLRSLDTGKQIELQGEYFLDATDLGELVHLSGAEWVTGAESAQATDELHAPSKANPQSQQAFTWAMGLEYRPGKDFRGSPPKEYNYWRNFVPDTHPVWGGPLLSWDGPNPATLKPRRLGFNPVGTTTEPNLWTYRRVRDASLFQPGAKGRDVCIVNWPQNDYFAGALIGDNAEEVVKHRESGRQLSSCLLHWLQTEAPRPDGGVGWPGLRLCPAVMGTSDGVAHVPYIRESRRICAEFTLGEKHLGVEQRGSRGLGIDGERGAEPFSDSIGIGAYRIDLHPTSTGDNYLDISSYPFQIPMGTLIPIRLENLLPAAKNIGTTHISNGCARVHPVEWNIGESAGHLAAYCLDRHSPPRFIRTNLREREGFQARLVEAGIELAWPKANRGVAL